MLIQTFRIFLVIISLLILLPPTTEGKEQNITISQNIALNQVILHTSERLTDVDKQLYDGTRCFVIKNEIPATQFFQSIKKWLNTHRKQIIVLLYSGNDKQLYSALEQSGLNNKLYSQPLEENFWPQIKDLISTNQRLIVYSKQALHPFFDLKKHVGNWQFNFIKDQTTIAGNSLADLACVRYTTNDTIAPGDSLIWNFNKSCGKLPNFMMSPPSRQLFNTINQINNTRLAQGVVLFNKQKVKGVSWLQIPTMTSYGKFFIPQTQSNISPQKNGFRFSPDVVSFTRENKHVIKIFQAIPLPITDKLTMHFDFDKNLKNQLNKEAPIIASQVQLVTNKERGKVATFNGHGSYIDYGQTNQGCFEHDFTICLWVKPDRLSAKRSFIGKGETFSAKLHNGSVVFTMPAVKDHVSDQSRLKNKQWQHVAYVFNANQSLKVYINGKLTSQIQPDTMNHTSHSLLIGSNLWDEFYSGLMDDLMIWERGLNSDEIKLIYQNGLPHNVSSVSINKLWWLIPLILMFIAVAISRYFRSKKQPILAPKENKPDVQHEQTIAPKTDNYSINLFGGFSCKDLDGNELTERFSPRRKQIFILILIYSLKYEKGITSKQMTDFLWAGHSPQSAKNNRSTNIQRVREILENTGVEIIYQGKYWSMEMNELVTCDFAAYLNLSEKIKQHPADDQILRNYINLVNKGRLLPNMEYEWLDNFQNEVTENVLQTLISTLNSRYESLTNDLRMAIAETILMFDPVNEEATQLKINVLLAQGLNKPAKDIYDHFVRTYHNFYDEQYPLSFKQFIEQHPSS